MRITNTTLKGYLKIALAACFVTIGSSGCLESSITPTPVKGGATKNCQTPNTGFLGGIDPAIPLTASTASITWNPALITGCSFVYKVYKLPDLATPVAFATGSASNVTISGLTPGTTAQYIVRIFDGKSDDTNLAVVNLTMPPQTIGAFSIDPISSSTNHKPTITWTAAANAQTYKLEIAWDPSFSTNALVANVSGLTGISYSFASDLPMGKYWVKVTASANNTPDVIASNSPQVFFVYPKFEGCLQKWYNGSVTSWQTDGCGKGKGVTNGYLYSPLGLVYDAGTGYLYIGNHFSTARWDMNSFSAAGILSGYYAYSQNNAGWQSSAYVTGGGYRLATIYNRGCSDGTYYYVASYTSGVIDRIHLATQTWAGSLGGGFSGWNMSLSTGATAGSNWDQLSNVGENSVACNSTDPYLYIADNANNRIARWTKTGNPAGVWGNGTGATWSTSGTCCSAGGGTSAITNPENITLSSSGVLYFSDTAFWARKGRILNLTNPVIDGWICDLGWTNAITYGAAGCTTAASSARTMQMATDSSGNLYIADDYNNSLAKYNTAGIKISGISFSLGSQSSPTYANIGGIAVKPDGSLIMVTDIGGVRVMLFDGSMSYLGYVGAGANGIASSTAQRPPTSGLGSSGILFAVDHASDSLYVTSDAAAPGYTFDVSRYSIASPASPTARTMTDLVIGNASPCIGPGANAACASYNGYDSLAVSKTADYVYQSDWYNGRVNRWSRTSLSYGGWIGGGSDGWKTSPTVAPSNANCAFASPEKMATDKNGHLYVFDGNANRILVWRESDGVCLGTLGGGYDTLQSSLVAQASVTAAKYYTYPGTTLGAIGDWLFAYTYGHYTFNRYTMTNLDPSTLTWSGWIGGGSSGWKTANYAGVQNGAFDNGTYVPAFGAGGVAASTYGNSVYLVALGDGTTMGKMLDATMSTYDFTTGSPTLGGGLKSGDGQVFSLVTNTHAMYGQRLYFDPSSHYLYIVYPGEAIVRYR